MAEKELYLSISDIKKLLNKSKEEFTTISKEILTGMVENGKASEESAQAQYIVENNTLQSYLKIVNKLIDNLCEYKRAENDK